MQPAVFVMVYCVNFSADTNQIVTGHFTERHPCALSNLIKRLCVYPSSPTVKNSPYLETGIPIINNSGLNPSLLNTTKTSCPTRIHLQTDLQNQKVSPRFLVANTDCTSTGAPGSGTMNWAQACGWPAVRGCFFFRLGKGNENYKISGFNKYRLTRHDGDGHKV